MQCEANLNLHSSIEERIEKLRKLNEKSSVAMCEDSPLYLSYLREVIIAEASLYLSNYGAVQQAICIIQQNFSVVYRSSANTKMLKKLVAILQ